MWDVDKADMSVNIAPSCSAPRAMGAAAALLEVLPGHPGGVRIFVACQPDHHPGSHLPQDAGAVC